MNIFHLSPSLEALLLKNLPFSRALFSRRALTTFTIYISVPMASPLFTRPTFDDSSLEEELRSGLDLKHTARVKKVERTGKNIIPDGTEESDYLAMKHDTRSGVVKKTRGRLDNVSEDEHDRDGSTLRKRFDLDAMEEEMFSAPISVRKRRKFVIDESDDNSSSVLLPSSRRSGKSRKKFIEESSDDDDDDEDDNDKNDRNARGKEPSSKKQRNGQDDVKHRRSKANMLDEHIKHFQGIWTSTTAEPILTVERSGQLVDGGTINGSTWTIATFLDVDKCLQEFKNINPTLKVKLQVVNQVENVLVSLKKLSTLARQCRVNVNIRRTEASVLMLKKCRERRRGLERELSKRKQVRKPAGSSSYNDVSGDRETDAEKPDNDNDIDVVVANEDDDQPDDNDEYYADDEANNDSADMDELMRTIQSFDFHMKNLVLNMRQVHCDTQAVHGLMKSRFVAMNERFNERYEAYLVDKFQYQGDNKKTSEKIIRCSLLCATEKRKLPERNFEIVVEKSGTLNLIATRFVHDVMLRREDNAALPAVLPRVFVNISECKKMQAWNVLTTDEDLRLQQHQQDGVRVANVEDLNRVKLGLIDVCLASLNTVKYTINLKAYCNAYLTNKSI